MSLADGVSLWWNVDVDGVMSSVKLVPESVCMGSGVNYIRTIDGLWGCNKILVHFIIAKLCSVILY